MTAAQRRAATMQALREHMRRSGRKYVWLARQLQMDPDTLFQIVNGRFLTPAGFFADVAAILAIAPEEIDDTDTDTVLAKAS